MSRWYCGLIPSFTQSTVISHNRYDPIKNIKSGEVVWMSSKSSPLNTQYTYDKVCHICRRNKCWNRFFKPVQYIYARIFNLFPPKNQFLTPKVCKLYLHIIGKWYFCANSFLVVSTKNRGILLFRRLWVSHYKHSIKWTRFYRTGNKPKKKSRRNMCFIIMLHKCTLLCQSFCIDEVLNVICRLCNNLYFLWLSYKQIYHIIHFFNMRKVHSILRRSFQYQIYFFSLGSHCLKLIWTGTLIRRQNETKTNKVILMIMNII